MIRLAHFIHNDSPGGGPKVVRQLLAGLPSPEFEQCLISGGDGKLSQWCAAHGIAHHRVSTQNLLSSALHIVSLARAFRKARPDVLILHGQWAGPFGMIAARLARVPRTVYIAHHPSFYHSTSLWRAVRNYIAEKVPCSQSDRVVALCNKGQYNYLYRGWGPENRLVRIYNGMDPSDVPTPDQVSALRRTESLSSSARHAVCVGRLDDQKRVDWLIEAWEVACSLRPVNAPEWHLWIVGGGREASKIRALAKGSAHASTIHLMGERPDGLCWISAVDIVAMSSLYEGHALVPLEAMACGKPLVSFDTDGVGESVLHSRTGLLSRLGDTKALGRNLARLLAEPAESSLMGLAARRHLEEHFPLEKTIAAYAELLRDVAGER
jgi:glycosyltransferase involved in cell wall biosynthesis